ncbi:hypothetical protein A2U01_0095879 [Trifolium medium]|uniref:Uncharacterized protein n=1 Tax=Trifolium medium TaxID=97028 RepID=A0A392US70_9FABA|nr:hypothetical protein [Trifolium medium]
MELCVPQKTGTLEGIEQRG